MAESRHSWLALQLAPASQACAESIRVPCSVHPHRRGGGGLHGGRASAHRRGGTADGEAVLGRTGRGGRQLEGSTGRSSMKTTKGVCQCRRRSLNEWYGMAKGHCAANSCRTIDCLAAGQARVLGSSGRRSPTGHQGQQQQQQQQQQVRFAGSWGVPSKQRIAPATTTSQVDDTCQPGRTNAPATAPAVVTRHSAFLPLLLIGRHPGRLSNLPSPGRVTSHLHGRLSSQQGHSTVLFSKAERRTKVLLCEPNSMNVDSPLAPSLQPSSTSPPSRL